MTADRKDSVVQALMEEAGLLPDCAARNSICQRAARRAEGLGDLETAWEARCEILHSQATFGSLGFETLFVNLVWCLSASDREPERFPPSRVLWQYKWAVSQAPHYAAIPRRVLECLIEDLEARYTRAGWGTRTIIHRRIELLMALGELEQARSLLEEWQKLPRDRGSDCRACEADGVAELLVELGDDERAVYESRAIIAGRLSCATVPHSTFGTLLLPLLRLGRRAQARELYDRGRRRVAGVEEGGALLASRYLPFAAAMGEPGHAEAILRARLPQAVKLRPDSDRMLWFARAAIALELLSRRGIEQLDVPVTAGLTDGLSVASRELAHRCGEISRQHATALDSRNGNHWNVARLGQVAEQWRALS